MSSGKKKSGKEEDCFVKPVSGLSTKKAATLKLSKVSTNVSAKDNTDENISITTSSIKQSRLPTLYEDPERMFVMSAEECRETFSPYCAMGLYDIPEEILYTMSSVDDDDDAQKENRQDFASIDELINLF